MEFDLSLGQISSLLHHAKNPALAAMLPVIMAAILAEVLAIELKGRRYPWKDSLVSAGVAVGHALLQALANGVIVGGLAAAAYHFRLFTVNVSLHTPLRLLALFLLADFAFYWEHRCSHSVNLMWASHSVHHSIERMVLTASFRLAWTPLLSGVFLFYLPIVWLGFAPQWVFGMASASLVYQIFVHTELAPRVGWLEWLFNTPSAHRVHHASNDLYIDRNFGGVLLIWNHLFGTYQAERADVPIRFGLIHPRSEPANPFVIAYQELWGVVKSVARARDWREALGRLFAPPGWNAP